jgi:hypothetical protein
LGTDEEESDPDAVLAHYLLQKYKVLPHEYMKMSFEEKAFICASDKIQLKAEKRGGRK